MQSPSMDSALSAVVLPANAALVTCAPFGPALTTIPGRNPPGRVGQPFEVTRAGPRASGAGAGSQLLRRSRRRGADGHLGSAQGKPWLDKHPA